MLLLFEQVEELRRIRDAHSKYYKNGDDPSVWSTFIQGLDLGDNPEPDSDSYLKELRELKILLNVRIKALDAQIKCIKEDLTTH